MRHEAISMPNVPCPAAGKLPASGRIRRMRSSSSKRYNPATTRMMASYSPLLNLDGRVYALPRRSLITKCG